MGSSPTQSGDIGTITNLICKCHKNSCDHGFWDGDKNDGECIALMHSELSEALEALRNGDEAAVAEELADLCILVFVYCGARDIDLELAIEQKMEYNKTRPYKHGKKF